MSAAKEKYNQGLQAEKEGRFQDALRNYRAAARADASFRPAFLNLGALYSRAKRPDLALGFFRRALELGSDDAIYFNLGSECYKLQNFDESEKFLKQALKLNVRLLKAHILLAYLYKNQNRLDKAEIYFKNALKIEPANRMAALGYSVTLSEAHRYAEALKIVEAFLRQQRSDEFMNNLRAGLLLKLNRTEESYNVYRKLAGESKEFVSFTDHLKAARTEADAEYERMFSGIDDRIQERTARLREKIARRKQLMKNGVMDSSARKNGIEGAMDLEEDLREDLKDMVDLSFLHLFNGDTEKALKFLFQARKMKSEGDESP